MSGPWRDWPDDLPPSPPLTQDQLEAAWRGQVFEAMRAYLKRSSRHWPLVPTPDIPRGACQHTTTRNRAYVVRRCEVALLAAAVLDIIGWKQR